MLGSEVELKRMMKKFKRYIDKKGLTLSAGKSKVMVFEKGRGLTKRMEVGRRRNRRGKRNT